MANVSFCQAAKLFILLSHGRQTRQTLNVTSAFSWELLLIFPLQLSKWHLLLFRHFKYGDKVSSNFLSFLILWNTVLTKTTQFKKCNLNLFCHMETTRVKQAFFKYFNIWCLVSCSFGLSVKAVHNSLPHEQPAKLLL